MKVIQLYKLLMGGGGGSEEHFDPSAHGATLFLI